MNSKFIKTIDNRCVPIYNINAFIILYISFGDSAKIYLCGIEDTQSSQKIYYATDNLTYKEQINFDLYLQRLNNKEFKCYENPSDIRYYGKVEYIKPNKIYLFDEISINSFSEEYDYVHTIKISTIPWLKQITEIQEIQKKLINNAYIFSNKII